MAAYLAPNFLTLVWITRQREKKLVAAVGYVQEIKLIFCVKHLTGQKTWKIFFIKFEFRVDLVLLHVFVVEPAFIICLYSYS